MAMGERDAATGFATMFLVLILFVWQLGQDFAAGTFAGPDALQLWARKVLILIALSILLAIVVSVVAAILLTLLTGEKPDSRRDERDHDIDRRALRWAWHLLSFGLLGMIIDLALGASALRAVTVVLALVMLSEFFKDGAKLWLYRRGV